MNSARPSFLVVTGTSLHSELHLYRAQDKGHVANVLKHKGSAFSFEAIADADSLPGRSLVIPCATRAIDAVVEWQAMSLMLGGKSPYYFTQDMMAEPNFEPRDGGRHFGGRFDMWDEGRIRQDAELHMRDSKHRQDIADQVPLARYNCATLALGIVEHVAGVALDTIGPKLRKVTRAWSLQGWILHEFREAANKPVSRSQTFFVTGEQPVRIAALRA